MECPTVGSGKVQEQQPELAETLQNKFLKAAARAGRHRLLALLSDTGTHGEHLRGLELRTRLSAPLE